MSPLKVSCLFVTEIVTKKGQKKREWIVRFFLNVKMNKILDRSTRMSSEFKPQAPPPPYPGLKSIATAPPPPVVSSTLTSQDKPAAVVENDEVPNDKVQKANTSNISEI